VTVGSIWSAFGRRVADYQSIALLALVYVCGVGLSWALARVMGTSLLDVRPAGTSWRKREQAPPDLASMRRPY